MMDDERREERHTIARWIDEQIAFNSGKNLFHEGGGLAFNERMMELVGDRDELRRILEELGIDAVVEYTLDRVIREFHHSNQYLDIGEPARASLRNIYRHLLDDTMLGTRDAGAIAERHYRRLACWLEATSPMAHAINPPERPYIENVVCAEYAPELQLRILGLDPATIIEPLLDVGCGERAVMVRYLRAQGIEAYGIDRLCDADSTYLFATNWFDFAPEPASWGTIISNLSFSSHFLNNHLRDDGRYREFATKYMELLNALKPGGRWHYAPSLPFIEAHLPGDRFAIERARITDEYERTVVRRL
jgi:hypothetical protein